MTSTQEQPKTKQAIWRKIERLPSGRSHVQVQRGALSHMDQLRLASELQRQRFAQACEAKEPGCADEVRELLETEARRQRTVVDPATDDGCRFLFTSLAKVPSEPVEWVWENYIPAGAVTILEGDPGVGKSLVLADLAARVSRGFLAPDRQPAFDEPGYDPEPAADFVWWFTGHDREEQTLAPRLRAAGANESFIRFIEGIADEKSGQCRAVQFPQDFLSMWKAQGSAPRLVIVDPLSAFCGGSLHQATAHKVMSELAKFAAATGAAVVVVRPLNRRLGASASERGSAGTSLLAEAKSALLLAPHPEEPSRSVLAVVKSNFAAKATSLELEILCDRRAGDVNPPERPPTEERSTFDERTGGLTSPARHVAPVIAWHGPTPLAANDLLKANAPVAARSPFVQKKVEEWLGAKLANGPKPVKEINEQAKLDDVPPVLLRRAQISLGVTPSGANGSTMWKLPEVALPIAAELIRVCSSHGLEHLDAAEADPPAVNAVSGVPGVSPSVPFRRSD